MFLRAHKCLGRIMALKIWGIYENLGQDSCLKFRSIPLYWKLGGVNQISVLDLCTVPLTQYLLIDTTQNSWFPPNQNRKMFGQASRSWLQNQSCCLIFCYWLVLCFSQDPQVLSLLTYGLCVWVLELIILCVLDDGRPTYFCSWVLWPVFIGRVKKGTGWGLWD